MTFAFDKATRGKTAPGRLKALDVFLARYEAHLLKRQDGLFAQAAFCDVGFGELPHTTLDAAECFWVEAPRLHVVGIEKALHRVAAAQVFSTPQVHFLEGGFDLANLERPVRLIRAMNVLREYAPQDVSRIHLKLGQKLLPGGLLVEGSCDKNGQLLTARFLRKGSTGLQDEGLLCYSSFEHGFAPIQFRDWLPQDLRRTVRPGNLLYEVFTQWTKAWEAVKPHASPREAFASSIQLWALTEPRVHADPWLSENGYLRFVGPVN